MPLIGWLLLVLLLVLHQDWWFWEDRSTWFGFLPVGLGWHLLISIAASAFWLLMVSAFWPGEIADSTVEKNKEANR